MARKNTYDRKTTKDLLITIQGPPGSGKSTVLRILAAHGFDVVRAVAKSSGIEVARIRRTWPAYLGEGDK